MADLTMCSGEGCPTKQKNICHRFTAKVNAFRQSYFAKPPVDEEGACRYFWLTEDINAAPKRRGNKKKD
jgi:hypothetical protein